MHADDLNMHFLSIPSRAVQSLPISSVSPLSYVSEANVPPLNLTAVTEDVVSSIICKLDPKRQLVVIIYLLKLIFILVGS